MPDLELYKISFTKAQLKGLKEEEVVFIIQVANLLQDASVLHKVIRISSKQASDETERLARIGQAMFFLRMLASVLCEARKVINHRLYKDVLQLYLGLCGKLARESLERFQKHFEESDNLVDRLRNNFASHHNVRYIRREYQQLPDNQQLHIFTAADHENCRYTASDEVINTAILKSINEDDMQAAAWTLHEQMDSILRSFADFAGECVLIFSTKRCSKLPGESVILQGVPTLDEMKLNYFVSY